MSLMRSMPFAALLASTILVHPAIVAAGPPPPPGQAPFDEIRLPNHGLLRGDVTELVPGRYVVLTKRTGEVRRFEWNQIESVVLADGTVLDQNTVPGMMPEPMPEPGPDPDPTVDPNPAIDPDPAVEPVPFDVDAEPEPEPEPEPAVATADGAGPHVLITPNRDGPPLSMRRVTAPDAKVGAKVPSNVTSEPVCEGACDVLVERPEGPFFIAVDGKPIARTFKLGTESNYEIKVRRKSPAMLWSGVALIPAAIIAGIGIGIIPTLHNVPRERIPVYAGVGAAIAVAGIGGGVTLILFSFDKVKVLPGLKK
jgi:hypothetical protein